MWICFGDFFDTGLFRTLYPGIIIKKYEKSIKTLV